jgi:hypothetical protein
MADEYIASEKCSRLGLRSLHIIGGRPVNQESWDQQIANQGGEVVSTLAYAEADLGLHHLHLYWRDMNSKPMYVVHVTKEVDAVTAAGRAAINYRNRFGQVPNRAVVREWKEPVRKIRVQLGDELVGELEIEERPGMLRGDVGVYCADE